MIGAAAALGAVIAAGGATYGGIKSGQKNREAMNLINQTQKDRKAWHELYQSQDWTMRADAQNRINQASKTLEEWNKRIKKTNTVAGGTDEAVALQKEAANKAYADVMANEGALASEAKDREAHQYVADNANINLQKAQMNHFFIIFLLIHAPHDRAQKQSYTGGYCHTVIPPVGRTADTAE